MVTSMKKVVFGALLGVGLVVSAAASVPVVNGVLQQVLVGMCIQSGSSSVNAATGLTGQDADGDQAPEPATMLILGTGLAGLAGAVRRKR